MSGWAELIAATAAVYPRRLAHDFRDGWRAITNDYVWPALDLPPGILAADLDEAAIIKLAWRHWDARPHSS